MAVNEGVDFNFIWQAVLIIVAGIVLLHISGRKSISQMTIGQTVLMVAVGTLLIQPVVSKNLWHTLLTALVLVLTLLVIEYLSLKINVFERLARGSSRVIIENGILKLQTMKKLRMTVDELEMHLRQKGIDKAEDVKYATIEMSGQLGYSLIDRKKYATKEDIDRIQLTLEEMSRQLNLHLASEQSPPPIPETTNLFSEIVEGHSHPVPKRLE
ncbi:Protein of unknown function [Sporosarcina newyorkensis]|uniref:YetF C-terminal domain-containing protein n=1 Tax=Sporosarcina newyorkensis TaxID=759851 RepID=A0A1T4YWE3_9BACL|nr:YetF domain-containing protein [Sporosarcina aquimarina]SKB06109.1 Protein of unknown function [Sporosarcina newyorkensis]